MRCFRQLLTGYQTGVPESPRYLIAKDRHDEALAILGKYHANGDTNNPTVQFEFREIRETIKREIAAKNSSSYLDFFRTAGNKYRFIVLISLGLFSQWSGNAIISNYTNILYANAGIESSTARLGLSAGQTGLSLVTSLTLAMQVDRFGRRPIFLASTGGMLMTFVFWTLSAGLYEEHGSPGSNYAMIFFIWLFGFFYAFAWSGLLISYSIEILPYKLRAKGLMIVNLTVQAALTLNNYANPYAFDYFTGHTWKLYLIYTVSFHSSPRLINILANDVVSHSAGSSSNSSLCTSSTSRQRDLRSRSSSRSSMAPTPRLRISTSRRSSRRSSSVTRPRSWSTSAVERGCVYVLGTIALGIFVPPI